MKKRSLAAVAATMVFAVTTATTVVAPPANCLRAS